MFKRIGYIIWKYWTILTLIRCLYTIISNIASVILDLNKWQQFIFPFFLRYQVLDEENGFRIKIRSVVLGEEPLVNMFVEYDNCPNPNS